MRFGGLRTRLLLMALAPLVPVLIVAAVNARQSREDSLVVIGLVALLAMGLVLFAGNRFIARPIYAQAREAEIDSSARERQRLLAELVAAEEEERKRIALDIHDDSIQALAALLLRLELLESRLEDDDHRASLAQARQSTREAVGRLRHLVFKLSPPELETEGLGPALDAYLAEIHRVWGPTTSLEFTVNSERSPELRALIYRITVEAINNAARHGHGDRIDVVLAEQDGGVRVRVSDDGAGFDPAASQPEPGHIGLRSMRERAEAAGGWWRVRSAPGEGTTLEFFVPDRAPRA